MNARDLIQLIKATLIEPGVTENRGGTVRAPGCFTSFAAQISAYIKIRRTVVGAVAVIFRIGFVCVKLERLTNTIIIAGRLHPERRAAEN